MSASGPAVDLEVARDDLRRTRVVEGDPPAVGEGQVLLAVERFGITSNNVTYALVGDRIGYWAFFPATDGWGRVPAWGFATVVAGASEGLSVGDRVFGFVPMGTHLVLAPRGVGPAVVDASAHRAELPSAYNLYRRAEPGPADEAAQDVELLLRPLFVLAFFLDDLLGEEGQMGAEEVWLSSASSKTALASAFLLARRGVRVIGLTSARNRGWVEEVGVYDDVVEYEAIGRLGRSAAVYVDVAGDLDLRRRVHEQLGDGLRHSAVIGATHADPSAVAGAADPDLPGPPPTFFFVPDRLRARTRAWGPDGVEQRMGATWRELAEWAGG